MNYLRDRIAPASKAHARERRERNRVACAPDPASPGARLTVALDWFRAAAAYASRRSYRSAGIREHAAQRRSEILCAAAAEIQQAGSDIAAPLPPLRNAEIRGAYAAAGTTAGRLDAAVRWLAYATRQAEKNARREHGSGTPEADRIRDRVTGRLCEWAEEMDADDYGE